MKFQNPSFKFFLNGWTHTRTDGQTDKPKAICSHFFKVGGITSSLVCREQGLGPHLLFTGHNELLIKLLMEESTQPLLLEM